MIRLVCDGSKNPSSVRAQPLWKDDIDVLYPSSPPRGICVDMESILMNALFLGSTNNCNIFTSSFTIYILYVIVTIYTLDSFLVHPSTTQAGSRPAGVFFLTPFVMVEQGCQRSGYTYRFGRAMHFRIRGW